MTNISTQFFNNSQFKASIVYLLVYAISFPAVAQRFSFDHADKGKIKAVCLYQVSNDKKELAYEKYTNYQEKEVLVKKWDSGKLYEKDSFTYDITGNLIGKFTLYRNGRIDSTRWAYDTFGNILSEVLNGSYGGNGITEYRYDNDGRLLMETFSKWTPDGYVLEEKEEIKKKGKMRVHTSYFRGNVSIISVKNFNPQNKIVSELLLIPEKKTKQRTIYKYDKKGRLLLSTFVDSEKKIIQERHHYTDDSTGNTLQHEQEINNTAYGYFKIDNYDASQNLIRSRANDDDGLMWELLFEFDVENRLLRKQKYDRDSESFRIETYDYDDQNNLTEKCVYNFEKNNISVQSYFYQYDKIGNWIRLKMDLNGEVFKEYMQEIVYFE